MKPKPSREDFTALCDWFRDPNRKRAELAFSSGVARWAATAFETAMVSEKPLPDRVTADPQIRSGVPCLAGTRLPFASVLANIAAGGTLKEFAHDMGQSFNDMQKALQSLSVQFSEPWHNVEKPDSESLPITTEWLRTLPQFSEGQLFFTMLLPPIYDDAAIVCLALDCVDHETWGVSLWQGVPDDAKKPDDHVTLTSMALRRRGELVRLLSALGIELKALPPGVPGKEVG